jgi:hypothetical protein
MISTAYAKSKISHSTQTNNNNKNNNKTTTKQGGRLVNMFQKNMAQSAKENESRTIRIGFHFQVQSEIAKDKTTDTKCKEEEG